MPLHSWLGADLRYKRREGEEKILLNSNSEHGMVLIVVENAIAVTAKTKFPVMKTKSGRCLGKIESYSDHKTVF